MLSGVDLRQFFSCLFLYADCRISMRWQERQSSKSLARRSRINQAIIFSGREVFKNIRRTVNPEIQINEVSEAICPAI